MLVVSRRLPQVDCRPAILVVEPFIVGHQMLSSIVMLRNEAHDIFFEARVGRKVISVGGLGLLAASQREEAAALVCWMGHPSCQA